MQIALLITAQISSALSLTFMGLALIGQLFAPEPANFQDFQEIILFSFFPIGVSIGMIISWWKWVDGNTLVCSLSNTYSVNIYSGLGSLIHEMQITGNEIHIPELTHGLYMISINDVTVNTPPFVAKFVR